MHVRLRIATALAIAGLSACSAGGGGGSVAGPGGPPLPPAALAASSSAGVPLAPAALPTPIETYAPSQVAAGCDVPSDRFAHAYYVDPATGSMSNDGSQSAPWRTLSEVFSDGLIYSAQTPHGIVKPGDVIYLRSGNHGAVTANVANAGFITVTGEAGASPVITQLTESTGSHWVFERIIFRDEAPGPDSYIRLVNLWGGDNIVLRKNLLETQPDVSAWTAQDWQNKGVQGIDDRATCATFQGNVLHNLRTGMGISADNALVQGNVIDNFADDAMDIPASNLVIKGNLIENSHAIGDGIHTDAVQGWTIGGATNHDILVDSNMILVSTVPNPPLPNPGLQGIDEFDGKWRNFTVTNNVVVTSAWHGIALYGVSGARIVNNTVLATSTNTTWIGVFDSKTGTAPQNNIVRNNIATTYNLATSGVTADHNLKASRPHSLFVRFDLPAASYDLHLAPGSAAIGAGTALDAPPYDITGRPRVPPIDDGAYAYGKR